LFSVASYDQSVDDTVKIPERVQSLLLDGCELLQSHVIEFFVDNRCITIHARSPQKAMDLLDEQLKKRGYP